MNWKRKLALHIIRRRTVWMALVLLLALLSVFMIGKTRINYDLTLYLAEDTMTRRALTVMEEEFSSGEQLRVMLSGCTEEEWNDFLSMLRSREGVRLAAHDPETDRREKDGILFYLGTVIYAGDDAAAFVQALRDEVSRPMEVSVSGSAAEQLDVQRSIGEEMPGVMLIAVAVVLAVLLLTSRAWLEPVLVLITLALSIVLNMGTHFIFPHESFITFAVCAILQLALSIDYAIMLFHTYNASVEEGKDAAAAMTDALEACFMRIASSAMTTVAGLLSLLFMSFTIGFDIGLALSKGIVLSMLCVFLFMPGAVLLCQKPLKASRHRILPMKGGALAKGIYRFHKPVALLLTVTVLGGLWLNAQTRFTFSAGSGTESADAAKINALFGSSNTLALLLPAGQEDEDYDRQRELVSALKDIRRSNGECAVGEITAMVTTGAQALSYYSVKDVAELTGLGEIMVSLFFKMQGFDETVRADRLLYAAESTMKDNETVSSLLQSLRTAREALEGEHYARMLLQLSFLPSEEDFQPCMDAVLKTVQSFYGQNYYATGVSMSSYDIGNAFQGDLMRVNLITFFAIFLIVALSFRSLRFAVLLVFVIEGAIWMNMGLSAFLGQPVFFISYLICLSIQMGATIDYGILFCDQYRTWRRAESSVQEALAQAFSHALPTVLTSGVILVVAGYLIGKMCSIYYISSIGLLISRGAFLSAWLVLTLLPALLALCDRFLMQKENSENRKKVIK